MGTPIHILLLDDHSLFREGLARLLNTEPGLSVVGHCATIGEALSALTSAPVDMVLLDYDLGNELGSEFLKSVSFLEAPPRVLLVTAGMSDMAIRDALAAGALGVVLKHCGHRQLIEAIKRAAVQEISSDSESVLREISLQTDRPYPAVLRERPLTKRQSSALHGILSGLSNKEIANRMNVSEGSVKAIIQELFHKAGVRTRSQLVRVAIEKHSLDWIR